MAAVGIDHCLAIINDFKGISLDIIQIVKDPKSLASIVLGFGLTTKLLSVLTEAYSVLPELKDIDSAEAGTLTTVFYEDIRQILIAAGGIPVPKAVSYAMAAFSALLPAKR